MKDINVDIIGIDPGTNKCAITKIDGTLTSPNFTSFLFDLTMEKKFKKDIDLRFMTMLNNVLIHINNDIDLVCCEKPFGVVGNASILLEFFGAIHYFCLKRGIQFLSVPQTRLKKYATNNGRAEKSDMRLKLYKEFNLELSEDETDSFWIAHMGMTFLYGSSVKYREESVKKLR